MRIKFESVHTPDVRARVRVMVNYQTSLAGREVRRYTNRVANIVGQLLCSNTGSIDFQCLIRQQDSFVVIPVILQVLGQGIGLIPLIDYCSSLRI